MGLKHAPYHVRSDMENLPAITVSLLGRRLTCMTVPSIVASICAAAATNQRLLVTHYNVHGFNLTMQLPWFHDFLQSADIAHCDSIGILKALQFMGIKLPHHYRASYTLLMPRLLTYCNLYGFSVFLLGGQPEVVQQAVVNQQSQFPNLAIAGHHGYFSLDDSKVNDQVIYQINQLRPHILIVGMGMPRQEQWLARYQHRVNATVLMAGGAIIDRLAGLVPDCPKWISDLGLEWLYRLQREPGRLASRYLLGNPALFLSLALAKAMGSSVKLEESVQKSEILKPEVLLAK